MSKELLVAVTQEILRSAGFSAAAAWQDDLIPRIVLSGDNLSPLAGRQGEHLGALEHLVRLAALRRLGGEERLPDFIIDVDDYRKSHVDRIAQLAGEIARRVQLTGRAEALPSMTAQERKIIHTKLASYEDVVSESIGSEPNRRVVIKKALDL